MISASHWCRANTELVAKMIAELAYEKLFTITPVSGGGYLKLEDQHYHFQGWKTLWDFWWIQPETLTVTTVTGDNETPCAATFLQKAAPLLHMTEATVAEHLEDLYATLVADCQLFSKREGMTARDLTQLPSAQLQGLLKGHPKFLFNKGRRGWGLEDTRQFSPEGRKTFQLHWLAMNHNH